MTHPARALAAAVVLLCVGYARADLKSYVQQPDKSYGYTIESVEEVGTGTAYITRLTSQTWHGVPWRHWLSIIKPKNLKHPDKAILFITGGSNRNSAPRIDSGAAQLLAGIAAQSGAVLAVLQQVPNQPIMGDRSEDTLIAYTFDQFLNGGVEDWPLLLPMTKSAVRAMDAVQSVAADKMDQKIKRFIVLGASKRGWTTWLTGAADKRVMAIAPMVIDMLNFGPQLRQQLQSYGKYSRMIRPYTDLKVPQRLDTEIGRRLGSIVDPYTYRKALTIPKLVLLGTNDPYWTVDASSLYFPDLVGDKHLYYEPNAGHGLGPGIFPVLLAFFNATLAGETLPTLNWQRGDDGALTVDWTDKHATAALWQATTPDRDFRKAQWALSPVAGAGRCQVNPPAPQPGAGWLAYYVQVTFQPKQGVPFNLCTEMTVLPKAFPHALKSDDNKDR